MRPLASTGWVVIGRPPKLTGQPLAAFNEPAVLTEMADSWPAPVPATSWRYFGHDDDGAAVDAAGAGVVSASDDGDSMTPAMIARPMPANDLRRRERMDPPRAVGRAVVADGLSQAGSKTGGRRPTEHSLRFAAIEDESTNVSRPAVGAPRLDLDLHRLADEPEDLVD